MLIGRIAHLLPSPSSRRSAHRVSPGGRYASWTWWATRRASASHRAGTTPRHRNGFPQSGGTLRHHDSRAFAPCVVDARIKGHLSIAEHVQPQRSQPLADDTEGKAHLPAGRGQAPRSHDPDEGAKFGDVVQHVATILSDRWRVTPFLTG